MVQFCLLINHITGKIQKLTHLCIHNKRQKQLAQLKKHLSLFLDTTVINTLKTFPIILKNRKGQKDIIEKCLFKFYFPYFRIGNLEFFIQIKFIELFFILNYLKFSIILFK